MIVQILKSVKYQLTCISVIDQLFRFFVIPVMTTVSHFAKIQIAYSPSEIDRWLPRPITFLKYLSPLSRTNCNYLSIVNLFIYNVFT